MRRLQVQSSAGGYEVMVGRGAWRALRRLRGYTSTFVLTEPRLWARWGRKFARDAGWRRVRPILVPSGESSKSLTQVGRVASELLQRGEVQPAEVKGEIVVILGDGAAEILDYLVPGQFLLLFHRRAVGFEHVVVELNDRANRLAMRELRLRQGSEREIQLSRCC